MFFVVCWYRGVVLYLSVHQTLHRGWHRFRLTCMMFLTHHCRWQSPLTLLVQGGHYHISCILIRIKWFHPMFFSQKVEISQQGISSGFTGPRVFIAWHYTSPHCGKKFEISILGCLIYGGHNNSGGAFLCLVDMASHNIG